jgi:hypothetical protein
VLLLASSLSLNNFLPHGVSCETSSDFRRMTAHHRRGAEKPKD